MNKYESGGHLVSCSDAGGPPTRPRGFTGNTDLSEGLLGRHVRLLDADPLPVEAGRLHALRGHGGVRKAHKDGVVVPPHSVQADEVLLGHG